MEALWGITGVWKMFFKVTFHLAYWYLTLKETKAVPIGHRTLGSVLYGNQPFDHSDDFNGLARCVADQYLHFHEISTKSTALLLHLYSSYPFHLGERRHPTLGFTQILCDPVDLEFAEVTNVPSRFSVPFLLWSSLIFWSLCLNSSMVGIGSLVPHTRESM